MPIGCEMIALMMHTKPSSILLSLAEPMGPLPKLLEASKVAKFNHDRLSKEESSDAPSSLAKSLRQALPLIANLKGTLSQETTLNLAPLVGHSNCITAPFVLPDATPLIACLKDESSFARYATFELAEWHIGGLSSRL